MIDVNNVVISDSAIWNNGKDWQHIVGYQEDGENIIPLFYQYTKKTHWVMVCLNTTLH